MWDPRHGRGLGYIGELGRMDNNEAGRYVNERYQEVLGRPPMESEWWDDFHSIVNVPDEAQPAAISAFNARLAAKRAPEPVARKPVGYFYSLANSPAAIYRAADDSRVRDWATFLAEGGAPDRSNVTLRPATGAPSPGDDDDEDAGLDLSALPWWVWVVGAGVLYYAIKD